MIKIREVRDIISKGTKSETIKESAEKIIKATTINYDTLERTREKVFDLHFDSVEDIISDLEDEGFKVTYDNYSKGNPHFFIFVDDPTDFFTTYPVGVYIVDCKYKYGTHGFDVTEVEVMERQSASEKAAIRRKKD